MKLLTLLGIALALAMDAFAVAVATGIAIRQLRLKHALIVGGWFGAFQALMPLIGWACGVAVRRHISAFDHWVAFALLAFIGGKMIWESFKIEKVERDTNPLDVYVLFVLSIATSVDALAVGLSFALLGVAILTPVLVIGGVTFCVCFAGVWIGGRLGHFCEKRIETVAGVVLIGIGLKILLSHL